MQQEGSSIKRIAYCTSCFLMRLVLLFIELEMGHTSLGQQTYFRYYTTDDGLPSNTIPAGPKERPVFQDKDGFIWLATFGGISIYDGHQFKNYSTENGGLSDDIVFAFFERRRDEIWVIESSCTDVFVNRKRVKSIPIKGYQLSNYLLTSDDRVLASRDGKIFEIRDNNPKPVAPAPGDVGRMYQVGDFFMIQGLNPDSVFLVDKSFQKIVSKIQGQVFQDRYQRFWYFNSKFYLLDTQGLKKGIFNLSHASAPMNEVKPGAQRIIDFLNDADGYYWFIVAGKKGVRRVDGEGSLKQFDINATCLMEDADGNIWMPDNAGFNKFYNKYNDFYSEKDGLPSDFVTGIAEDERFGTAWAVHKKGISCIRQNRIYNFSNPDTDDFSWGSVKVQNDSLWVYNDKLYLYKIFYEPEPHIRFLKKWAPADAPLDFISCLRVDQDGALMINLEHFGLFRTTMGGKIQKIHDSGLITFYIDGDELWTGGVENGLAVWKIIRGKDSLHLKLIRRYQHLPDDHIRDIVKDTAGNFWIGTLYKGILKFERREDGSFIIHNYFSKHGLSNPWVVKLSINSRGEIFAGTMGGIYQVHQMKDSVYIENMTARYGGISATWDYVQNAKNNFWLATPAGVVHVRNDLFRTAPPPKVFFTQLLKNNHSDSLVFNNAPEKFTYSENNLAFDFSATSFRNEDRVLYSYRLIKSKDSSEWSTPQNIHSLSLVSLAPGSYTLNVKAVTAENVWSQVPSKYSFIIAPPYWSTWWFRALAVSVIAVAITLFYKFRLNQLRKIMALRLKISRDLHDEIGSTLSGIGLISEMAKHQLNNEKTAEVKNSLDKININSDEMLEKMSDIVWTINPQNDSFEKVISRLRAYAKNTTDSLGIRLHFSLGEDIGRYNLDMRRRNNVYLICKEAINNAIKYSECHNLSFALQQEDHHFNISIVDDGKGFDTWKDFDGNGLKNMRSRAQEIKAILNLNSEKGKGTSIFLTLKIT